MKHLVLIGLAAVVSSVIIFIGHIIGSKFNFTVLIKPKGDEMKTYVSTWEDWENIAEHLGFNPHEEREVDVHLGGGEVDTYIYTGPEPTKED